MREIILVKYGEMALKGLNKKTFEDMLTKNIKRRIKGLGRFVCTSAQSTRMKPAASCLPLRCPV